MNNTTSTNETQGQNLQPPQGAFQPLPKGNEAFQNNGQVPQPPKVDANTAVSNLGFANNMLHHLLQFKGKQGQQAQQQQTQAPQTPKTAPSSVGEPKEDEQAEDTKLTDLEAKIDKKLEVLRTEVKDSAKVEIDSIRKEIKDALENEQD